MLHILTNNTRSKVVNEHQKFKFLILTVFLTKVVFIYKKNKKNRIWNDFYFSLCCFLSLLLFKTKNNKTDFEKIVICNYSLAALIFIVVCFVFLFTTSDSVPEFRFGIRVGEDGLCIAVVTAPQLFYKLYSLQEKWRKQLPCLFVFFSCFHWRVICKKLVLCACL